MVVCACVRMCARTSENRITRSEKMGQTSEGCTGCGSAVAQTSKAKDVYRISMTSSSERARSHLRKHFGKQSPNCNETAIK